MGKTNFYKFLFCVLLTTVVSACGGQTMSGSSSNSGLEDDVVGGNISAIVSTGVVDLVGMASDEEVLLSLYSYSTSTSSVGYEVSSLGDVPPDFQDFLLDDGVEDTEDSTDTLNQLLNDVEISLDENFALPAQGTNPSYLTKFATVGSQQTFKVLNSLSGGSTYDTVTATLVLENAYFQFYVDERNLSALSDDDLQSLADDFADVIPIERDFFGIETDVNGDGKFTVLFTQAVNELGGSSGGMITGFFYAVDLFDSAQYILSNEREIYYTLIPDPTGEYGSAVSSAFLLSNIYPGVLPHEYQHLISFNMHYNVNDSSSESSWLNEALSHLAEDIYSVNAELYMEETGPENPARVSSYLSNVGDICFTCGTSLSQRGGGYLFLRYLYEQAELGNLTGASSGEDLLNKLLDTDLTGLDNVIESAFGEDADASDFQSVLGHFGLAVYLSNTGTSSDNRLGFMGIDLRGEQDDNRGTLLNGPAIQSVSSLPYTDTMSGVSINFLKLTGQMVNDNGGSLTLGFGTGADFGGYIIRE